MRRLQEFEPIPGRYEREPDENREEGWTDWEQPVQRPCGRNMLVVCGWGQMCVYLCLCVCVGAYQGASVSSRTWTQLSRRGREVRTYQPDEK